MVCGPLTVVAFPIAEHRLRRCRLSGHGSRAQPLCGMWDLPGPGHEPVSPASASGLSTTAPPGKPSISSFVILPPVFFPLFLYPTSVPFDYFQCKSSLSLCCLHQLDPPVHLYNLILPSSKNSYWAHIICQSQSNLSTVSISDPGLSLIHI